MAVREPLNLVSYFSSFQGTGSLCYFNILSLFRKQAELKCVCGWMCTLCDSTVGES